MYDKYKDAIATGAKKGAQDAAEDRGISPDQIEDKTRDVVDDVLDGEETESTPPSLPETKSTPPSLPKPSEISKEEPKPKEISKEEPTSEYKAGEWYGTDTLKNIRDRLTDRLLPKRGDIEELLKFPDITPNTSIGYMFKDDKGMVLPKGMEFVKLRSILKKKDQLQEKLSQKNLLRQLTLLS